MEKAFEIKRFDPVTLARQLIKKHAAQGRQTANSVQSTMRALPTSPPVNDLPSAAAQTTEPSSNMPPASLKSRLLAMVYESMLLFAVLFAATLLFSTLLEQRHALYRRDDLQYWLYVVLGIYFCWFWRHGGQTLAMKTWRIQLLTRDGTPLSWARAVPRYMLAWLWFLPGLAAARYLNAQGWMLVTLPALNMLLWALAVFLDRDRQFLHDRLAGTRIIQLPPIASPEKSASSA